MIDNQPLIVSLTIKNSIDTIWGHFLEERDKKVSGHRIIFIGYQDV